MRAALVTISIIASATVIGCGRRNGDRAKDSTEATSPPMNRPIERPAAMLLNYRIQPAHPRSTTAIQNCLRVLNRAPSLPPKRRRRDVAMAFSGLFAHPECRRAWARTGTLDTFDGVLDYLMHAIETCRRTHCPELLRWKSDRVLPRPEAITWKVCEVKTLPKLEPDRMIMVKELLSLIFIRDHCGVLKSNLSGQTHLKLVARDLDKLAQLQRISHRILKSLLDSLVIETPRLIRTSPPRPPKRP